MRFRSDARAGRRTRALRGRVRANPRDPRAAAEPGRARRLLGHVERALLLQVVARAPEALPTEAPRVICRARARTRAWSIIGDGHGRRLQDGEPQPPDLHRALPGGGDRASAASCATSSPWAPGRSRSSNSLRFGDPGPPEDPPPGRRRGRRHRAATATASACPRSAARSCSTPPTTATSWSTPCAWASRAATRSSTAAPPGVGNPVLYVGAKTGRDGIHGATMASAEFDDATEAKRPTVQVGDPFTEKLLLEACLELMQTGRDRRHPGHGRRRPHLVVGRDGGARRQRHRARPRPGADCARAA